MTAADNDNQFAGAGIVSPAIHIRHRRRVFTTDARRDTPDDASGGDLSRRSHTGHRQIVVSARIEAGN